jgi:hypothetical protein
MKKASVPEGHSSCALEPLIAETVSFSSHGQWPYEGQARYETAESVVFSARKKLVRMLTADFPTHLGQDTT